MQTRFNAFAPTFSSLQRFGAKDGKKRVPPPIDSSAVDSATAAQLAELRAAQNKALVDHQEDKPTLEEDNAFKEDMRQLSGKLTPHFFKAHSPQFNKVVGDKTESQLAMADIREALPGLMGQASEDPEVKKFIADLRKMLKTPPPKSPVSPTGEKLKPTKYKPDSES